MISRQTGAYVWLVDYRPTYRWRRWIVRAIPTDADLPAREWRCLTFGDARRLSYRLALRTGHAIRKLDK